MSSAHYGAVLRRIKQRTKADREDLVHLMQANMGMPEDASEHLDSALASMDRMIQKINAFFDTSYGRGWGE